MAMADINEEQYFEAMYAHATTSSSDIGSDVKYVKSEMQMPETKFEEGIPPVDRLSQQTTCGETWNDPDVEVKSEKVESEAGGSGETRRWVVCEGGVLKEVKVESTDWNPDTRETSMCNENINYQELCNNTVRPYVCVTCGKSFQHKSNLTNHELIHTEVTPYTCGTCGKSFKRSAYLTAHQNGFIQM